MNDDGRKELSRLLHQVVKKSLNTTKTCYVLDCNNPLIKAHSVSHSRYLKLIAERGEVLYLSTEGISDETITLVPTGKIKATTFPGFCNIHDKYFEPIDNHDYIVGDRKQEFLFSFRAAAREYTVRHGVERMLKDAVENKYPELNISDTGKELLRVYLMGFAPGTADLTPIRIALNKNIERERYWKINSEVLILDKEYPIVASSIFKLEQDPTGRIINLIPNLVEKAHPCFFTIIPQNGKTYCIISWMHQDEYHYQNLRGLNRRAETEKRVIISNLLCNYVENFAVNPKYWESLPEELIKDFHSQWGISMHEVVVPFIYNKNLSLFA